jgi:hypothetical protein
MVFRFILILHAEAPGAEARGEKSEKEISVRDQSI